MKTGPKGIYAHSAEITIQESTRRLWRNSIDIEASREAKNRTHKEYGFLILRNIRRSGTGSTTLIVA